MTRQSQGGSHRHGSPMTTTEHVIAWVVGVYLFAVFVAGNMALLEWVL